MVAELTTLKIAVIARQRKSGGWIKFSQMGRTLQKLIEMPEPRIGVANGGGLLGKTKSYKEVGNSFRGLALSCLRRGIRFYRLATSEDIMGRF